MTLVGRVIRHEIPVDDRWHPLHLNGAVLHVDARPPDTVEVWTLDTGGPTVERRFVVVGTGHFLPDGVTDHVGSAITVGGALVWHLFEGTGP